MKFALRGSLLLVIAVAILTVVLNLKNNDNIVEVKFSMLACENCNHLDVVKSSSPNLIGKLIIPKSININIDEVINNIINDKTTLCLLGQPYRYNPNLFGISPDGIRFQVNAIIPLEQCKEKINNLTSQ